MDTVKHESFFGRDATARILKSLGVVRTMCGIPVTAEAITNNSKEVDCKNCRKALDALLK